MIILCNANEYVNYLVKSLTISLKTGLWLTSFESGFRELDFKFDDLIDPVVCVSGDWNAN